MKFIEKKELEGRYAAYKRHSGDTYYHFTDWGFERYDAETTGFSLDYEIMNEAIEEYKAYNDREYLRYSTGLTTSAYTKAYSNYQIDYDKCAAVTEEAEKRHRRPQLTCFFRDYEMTWDLLITDEWRYDTEIVPVNQRGYDYGAKKENKLQSFLPLDGPHGPIRKTPIEDPDRFWDEVAEEIKKDHPDYTPSWIKNNK